MRIPTESVEDYPVSTHYDWTADLAAAKEAELLLKAFRNTDSEVNNCLVTP